MKYFFPFYLMYFTLIEDIRCYHSHYRYYPYRPHRKRSEEPLETSTWTLARPEDKEQLKGALDLLNLGKVSLGLKTESPDLLLQLMQDSSDNAKAEHIQQILQQQPDASQELGKQYLVLSGQNGKMHVDNFTTVTEKPDVVAPKGNVQDVFKMELEKKLPSGKQNVTHKVTIVETNRQLPIHGIFSPKQKRDRTWYRLRRFYEPHGRQKRGREESLLLIFPNGRGEEFSNGKDRREDMKDGDTFRNEEDNVDSNSEIRQKRISGHSRSLLANFQQHFLYKDKDSLQVKAKLGEDVRSVVAREFRHPFQKTSNSVSKYPLFQPQFRSVLMHHNWPLHHRNSFEEPADKNESNKDIENVEHGEHVNTFFRPILLLRSTPSVPITEHEFKPTDRNAEMSLLTEGVTFRTGTLFGNTAESLKRLVRQKLSVLPSIRNDQTALQNQVFSKHSETRENVQVNLLTLTSVMTFAMLCFITGLLLYSRFRDSNRALSAGTLTLEGKNVTVKVCDESSNVGRKKLIKKPFCDSGFESVAVEDDFLSNLEWQSELGEWLSDLDEKKST